MLRGQFLPAKHSCMPVGSDVSDFGLHLSPLRGRKNLSDLSCTSYRRVRVVGSPPSGLCSACSFQGFGRSWPYTCCSYQVFGFVIAYLNPNPARFGVSYGSFHLRYGQLSPYLRRSSHAHLLWLSQVLRSMPFGSSDIGNPVSSVLWSLKP